MKKPNLFIELFNSEKTGGLILIFCTAVSVFLANSGIKSAYLDFWEIQYQGHSITHWINDGLMAIFFLMIGLELKREIYLGELGILKNALLPIIAAIGGVMIPAAIYLFFNYGTAGQAGAGIPMATDIAFAIAVLTLVGNKVPSSLKIFLTALAVIDDLCAIIVIAIFYNVGISWFNLSIALVIFILLFIMNRLKVKQLFFYLLGGTGIWYFMLQSGIHATIAGVLLAFVVPFDKTVHSPSHKLQHYLHKPVAFIILPLFALANTAIVFEGGWPEGLLSHESLGIITGLLAGKPTGIVLFSFIAVKAGVCALPAGLGWKHILGAGMLAGIGFTMSIFITLLAFEQEAQISISKISIISASLIAALCGLIFLKITLNRN